MLQTLCPPRRARIFDYDFRQSELRSCNFIIELLNQDHRDYIVTADRGTHKNSQTLIQKYLRNRKNVACFHTVIETQVEIWENE